MADQSADQRTIALVDEIWDPLVVKLGVFACLMRGHSKIHPYAREAWYLPWALKNEYRPLLSLDEKGKVLVEKLTKVYGIILAYTQLGSLQEDDKYSKRREDASRTLDLYAETLRRLSISTLDCVLTIFKYTNDRHFFTTFPKTRPLSGSEELDRFSKKFEELTQTLRHKSLFSSECMSIQLFQDVGEIQIELGHFLPQLQNDCLVNALCRSDERCLEGTRATVLDRIRAWSCDPSATDPRRVYLLLGAPGTGKSAIANSFARYSENSKPYRFGASYSFSTGHVSSEEKLQRAIPTIAWQLANSDPFFRVALWRSHRTNWMLRRRAFDFQEQLKRWLLEPALQIPRTDEPTVCLVIVIDALDQMADVPERRRLLRVLSDGLGKLPTHFRLLLTARPEPDILELLDNSRSTLPIWIPHVDQDETLIPDIQKFVRHALRYEAENARFKDADYEQLAHMSHGLYGWARMACDCIIGDGRGNSGTPRTRYEALCREYAERRDVSGPASGK